MIDFKNLSYWEQKYVQNLDFIIIGSGIVGLTTALFLKERKSDAKIAIVERGYLPTGASTKNAGFACFGSPTELLEDLKILPEKEVIALIKLRYDGLKKLKKLVPPSEMDLSISGTYELFQASEASNYTKAINKLDYLNSLIEEATNEKKCFEEKNNIKNQFNAISFAIKNKYEGHLDTGKMMRNLLYQCYKNNILFLNGLSVKNIQDQINQTTITTQFGELSAKKVIVTTNGFTKALFPEIDIYPARAQVLITTPFQKLPFEGAFHMQEGYFYFRTIDNRILIGGGRHLDFKNETSIKLETTENIQNAIKEILFNTILPKNTTCKIEHQWAGIMGVGRDRFPLVKQKGNIILGVKMGGMGIAIGSEIGSQLADLAL